MFQALYVIHGIQSNRTAVIKGQSPVHGPIQWVHEVKTNNTNIIYFFNSHSVMGVLWSFPKAT